MRIVIPAVVSALCFLTAAGCVDRSPVAQASDGSAATLSAFVGRSERVGVTSDVCTDAAPPALAAPLRTIYVDAKKGNDNADGRTPRTAWRTLAKANAAAQPGDLFLLSGTFNGQYIRPNQSGTAAQKIVFQSLTPRSAVIERGDFDVILWLDGRQHIVIDGLEIRDAAYAILLRDGANNNWLRNLDVHDVYTVGVQILQSSDNRIENSSISRCGAAMDNTGDCIWIADGSDRNVVARNTIFDSGHGTVFIGGDRADMAPSVGNVLASNDLSNSWAANIGLIGRGAGTTVECNRIHDTSTSGQNYARTGIQISTEANVVRFNEIYENSGDGIQVQAYDFRGMTQNAVGNQIYHNSVWGNGGAALQLLQKDVSQVRDNVIENNIFWDNNAARRKEDAGFYAGAYQDVWVDLYNADSVWPDGSLNGNTIRNNIIARDAADIGKGWLIIVRTAANGDNSYFTMAEAQAAFSDIAGNRQKDPLFAKIHKDDVQLRAGSPAIDAGLPIPGVAFRGGAPDIGAHELR